MKQRFSAGVFLAAMLSGGILLRAQTIQGVRTPPQSWESCEEMHDNYVRRFESTPGFGLSRMAREPMLDRSGMLETGRDRYSFGSIELIGLLKLETPVVYVPSSHGAKPAPDGFTSRALTTFEKTALAAFTSGSEMASTVDRESGTLRCIGALRAKGTCLSCHKDKKSGDLLGAFSYTLEPVKRSGTF